MRTKPKKSVVQSDLGRKLRFIRKRLVDAGKANLNWSEVEQEKQARRSSS